ncbi:MAG: FHA domain-containing protein [Bradymonadales bacterium]|jgi:pSer/pThr/pTyr-binding forkhead associated (FHA) protein
MYTLIIEDAHGRAAEEISFSQGSYTIGRVEGSDIILPSSSVSRTHARISISNGKCYIDDLGSANGIIVNGVSVKTRQELKNGAKVRIGEYTLYLEYKEKLSGEQDILRTQIVASNQNGYKLVRVGDKFAGEEFSLSESQNSIGRTEDNYILLSDPSISRNHAAIHNLGITSRLTDLGSSNGTFVNGKRVKGDILLQSGDEIRFGNIRFIFVPISARVDLHMYARSRYSSNRTLYVIVAASIIVFVACCSLLLVYFLSSQSKSKAKPVAELKQDPQLLLSSKLSQANEHYSQMRYAKAEEVVQEILLEWPNDISANKLLLEIQKELHNDALMREADALYVSKLYEEAIEKYSEVSAESPFAGRAASRIEEVEAKIIQSQYITAKSSCDIKPDPECMQVMCTSVVQIKDFKEREERIKETRAFVNNYSKRRDFVAAVRHCRKALEQ